jgi:acyl carrier protein
MIDHKTSIRNFVIQNFLFGQAGNLTDGASFLQEGIIDSTGVLELTMHLETAYGIKVKDEELVPENLDSINGLASFLERKLSEQRPPSQA